MRFLNRWIYKKLKKAAEQEQQDRQDEEMNAVSMKMATSGSIGIGRGPTLDSNKGIRFQVYKATGGMVVETSMYDQHRDRHTNGLYIITDDQDLGKEIAKIITMETLKQ
jgi:hypothetical protein